MLIGDIKGNEGQDLALVCDGRTAREAALPRGYCCARMLAMMPVVTATSRKSPLLLFSRTHW